MIAPAGKRMLDVVVGAAACLVTLPLVLALAVAVAVSLRSWPFFTQQRVGRDGRLIRIVKLRTLPPAAPAYASKYQLPHVAAPRFCGMLRRLHLDELPQLWLVVAGPLSLVGPRPEMPFLSDAMDPAFVAARTRAKPGCTGMWQISPWADRLIGEAPQYDWWYVHSATVRVDLWVLWRTALLILGLAGPADLDDVPRWATWGPAPETTGPVADAPSAFDPEAA